MTRAASGSVVGGGGERGAGAAEMDGGRSQPTSAGEKAGASGQGQGAEGRHAERTRTERLNEQERARELESLPSLRRLRMQEGAGGAGRTGRVDEERVETAEGLEGVLESWGRRGKLDKSSLHGAEGAWAGGGAAAGEAGGESMTDVHRLQPPSTHSLQQEAQGAWEEEAGVKEQAGNREAEEKKRAGIFSALNVRWNGGQGGARASEAGTKENTAQNVSPSSSLGERIVGGQARELTIDLYNHGEREGGLKGNGESSADDAGAGGRAGGGSTRVSSSERVSAGTGRERCVKGGEGEGKMWREKGLLHRGEPMDVDGEGDEEEERGGHGQRREMWHLGGLDSVDRMIAREIKRVLAERTRDRGSAGDRLSFGFRVKGLGFKAPSLLGALLLSPPLRAERTRNRGSAGDRLFLVPINNIYIYRYTDRV